MIMTNREMKYNTFGAYDIMDFIVPGENIDANKAQSQLTGLIAGKYKYYVAQLGQPTSQAQLDKIRGMISADLINEGVKFTASDVNNSAGDLITGGLKPSVILSNAAQAVSDAIPWYLHPTNVLLMGGGAVVLYFTWPILLKMGFGTVKRGVKSFSGSKK